MFVYLSDHVCLHDVSVCLSMSVFGGVGCASCLCVSDDLFTTCLCTCLVTCVFMTFGGVGRASFVSLCVSDHVCLQHSQKINSCSWLLLGFVDLLRFTCTVWGLCWYHFCTHSPICWFLLAVKILVSCELSYESRATSPSL